MVGIKAFALILRFAEWYVILSLYEMPMIVDREK